jgi:hypothetical protein
LAVHRRQGGRRPGCLVRPGGLGGREHGAPPVGHEFGRPPDGVVDRAVAHLVGEGDDIAGGVEEGRLEEVVVEPVQLIEDVIVGPRLDIGVLELRHAPGQGRRRIGLRKPELHVVTGVVHSTGQVEISVAIGVEHRAVLVDEGLRQVGPVGDDRFPLGGGHRGQLDLAVLRFGVAAPFQWLPPR